MIQALLQTVVQRYPVEQQLMAAEHNEMAAVLREVAGIVVDAQSEAAGQIRERGEFLGRRDDFVAIPANEEIVNAHRELSQALIDTMTDLDTMLRDGDEVAGKALARLRQHITGRTLQEFNVYTVGAGMAGRG